VRDYTNYKQHVKATGRGRRQPPWFFDLVDELLSQRHTVNPVAVADTLTLGDISGISYTWSLLKQFHDMTL